MLIPAMASSVVFKDWISEHSVAVIRPWNLATAWSSGAVGQFNAHIHTSSHLRTSCMKHQYRQNLEQRYHTVSCSDMPPQALTSHQMQANQHGLPVEANIDF